MLQTGNAYEHYPHSAGRIGKTMKLIKSPPKKQAINKTLIYALMTAENGKQFLYDPVKETTIPIIKKSPRYLKVLK